MIEKERQYVFNLSNYSSEEITAMINVKSNDEVEEILRSKGEDNANNS